MIARASLRSAVPALVALAAAALAPAAGAATVHQVPGRGLVGLHDARYCEILELRGAPPTGRVDVFNTIGLNACPPAQWDFDAPSLAKELGATLVVLNGPRHFLMDEVKGTVGPVRSFHGLQMRKAATIPIRTAGDLAVKPFTDRTITRDNTWRWDKGRKVFELVAPGGDTYVMQSYSQIKDPSLTLARLSGLGPKIGLPDGWRYRTRVLRRPLALSAKGAATITQDELGNTYQLATTVRRGPRKARDLSLSARTATVPARTAGTVEDHGSVTGTPFGTGRLVLVGVFGADSTMTATVRLTFPAGSVVVSTTLPYTISDGQIHFRGTSRVVGGTGAYRGITSGPLVTVDDNTLDGQNGTVSVKGRVTF
jgi:hypothetical protein